MTILPVTTRNLDAGRRFYDAVQADFERLAQFPGIGAIRKVRNPKLHGLRSLPITGFRNYQVVYFPLAGGGIDVLYVLHGARNVDPVIERG